GQGVGGADGFLRLVDQTRLPSELTYRDCRDPGEVREAIRALRVRGAPAIGVAAAYGVVLAAQKSADLGPALELLRTSRPTAVNLAWALERMAERARAWRGGERVAWLLEEAHAIAAEDERMCAAIGAHGAALIAE